MRDGACGISTHLTKLCKVDYSDNTTPPRKESKHTQHPMEHAWQAWEIAVSIVLCTLSVVFSVSFMCWLGWKIRKMKLRSQEPDFDMVNRRVVDHPPDDIELGIQTTGDKPPARRS